MVFNIIIGKNLLSQSEFSFYTLPADVILHFGYHESSIPFIGWIEDFYSLIKGDKLLNKRRSFIFSRLWHYVFHEQRFSSLDLSGEGPFDDIRIFFWWIYIFFLLEMILGYGGLKI